MKSFLLYALCGCLLLIQCRPKQPVTPQLLPVNNTAPAFTVSFFDTLFKKHPETGNGTMVNYLQHFTDSLGRIDKKSSYPQACVAAYMHFYYYEKSFAKKIDSLHLLFLRPLLDCGIDSIERDAAFYIGADIYEKEKFIDATTLLNKSLLLNEKTPFPGDDYKEHIFNTLANCYTRFGDYKLSLNHLYAAFTLNLKAGNYNGAAKNCNNIAIALFDLHQHDSAIALLQRTSRYPGIQNFRMGVLHAELSRHYTMLHQFDVAAKALRTAEQYWNAETAEGEKKEAALADIKKATRLLHFTKGEFLQVIANARKNNTGLWAAVRERDTGKVLKTLGDCYLQTGRPDSAMLYYQKSLYTVANVDSANWYSLPALQYITAENTIMEALDAKAGLFNTWWLQKKDIRAATAALQCWLLCFEVERKLMQLFSYDQSRLLMLKESRARSEKAIALCYALQQLTHDKQWAEKAFEIAEKNKAFVLLESIKRNNATNSRLQSDSAYKQIQLLKVQLASLSKDLVIEDKKDSAFLLLQQQQMDIEGRLALLEKNFINNNSWYRQEIEKHDTFSLAACTNWLPPGQQEVIEYFTGDSAVYSFRFSTTTPLVFSKTGSNLLPAVNAFLQFFSDPNMINNQPLAYRDAAYSLYTQLGLAPGDHFTNLLIIPDGTLSFIPFEALVTGKTGSVPANFSYLVNKGSISYAFSLGTLMQQDKAGRYKAGNFTAFAPVFDQPGRGLPPLTQTLTEIQNIRGVYSKGNYFVQQQATAGNFRQAAQQAGLLHIATHASADTQNALTPRIEFYDSAITLAELYTLNLQTPLVVLSACETGIGKIEKSEGPMSLARGFYYAGARNVINSLWRVDDRSTAQLVTGFYKSLDGNGYAAALQKAKLDYIHQAQGAMASPYYWAALVHIGYNRPPTPAPAKNWWWLSAIPVIIVIIWVMGRKT